MDESYDIHNALGTWCHSVTACNVTAWETSITIISNYAAWLNVCLALYCVLPPLLVLCGNKRRKHHHARRRPGARRRVKRIITKFKGKWWHSPVSRWAWAPWKPYDLFAQSPGLHLGRSEKGEEIARRRNIFHLRLWTSYQWWLHSDIWFLIIWFLQRYSANRCTFTFQKGRNCFHFSHSVSPPPPPKVTFISESVFLRVYL